MIWAAHGQPQKNRIMKPDATKAKLTAITIDASIRLNTATEAEHERKVAIYDLLEDNHFVLKGGLSGPYKLILSNAQDRLVFDVRSQADAPLMAYGLSLTPFRRVLKDYVMICESYNEAVRNSSPAQIETIDMARRGIHNEASEILMERLAGKITMDLATARRLFTLVAALLWQGTT
jgi:uncharacterized protein (UPF0262 family)